MYKFKLVNSIDELHSWHTFINTYAQKHVITMAHNPSLINVLSETFGYVPESYLIMKNNILIGILPGVRIGSKYVSVPHFSYGGPVIIDDNSKKNQLHRYFFHQKYEIRSFDVYSDFINDEKVTCYIELPQSIEEQWLALKSKVRSQIRKGESYGLEIAVGGIELVDRFYEIYSKNMHRLGSPPLPKILFNNIFRYYKYGYALVTVIKYNNVPVAAGITMSYMGFNEVCWASSDYMYNKYNVNMVLYWEMIKHSISARNNIFSFGRSSKESNTLKFKLQWNPTVVPIYFNYSNFPSYNLKKWKCLASIWKKQPLFTSVILGKYISKYVY